MIILLILFVFVAVIASTWWFGIWNNVLTLVNLLLAGLIASGFYEHVTDYLNGSVPGLRHVSGFVGVWAAFVVSFMVLRAVTDMISSKKLKFEKTTELVGQSVLSLLNACVFVAFVTFTLHLSPLPTSAFQGDSSSTLGIGPDRFWLGFVQGRSRGALSNGLDARGFDGDGSFVSSNVTRRQNLAKKSSLLDF